VSDFPDPTADERFMAAVDLLRRTGADGFQFRFCDEEEPVVWMALAEWEGHWEVGASMHPTQALFRLCDQVIDGGKCQHCARPTAFTPDITTMPGNEMVCWYQWDPELKTFRRGCE
jgi:hypothetical protein